MALTNSRTAHSTTTRRTIRYYLNDFGFPVTSKDVPDEMRKEAGDDALHAVMDEKTKRQAKLISAFWLEIISALRCFRRVVGIALSSPVLSGTSPGVYR
jgi:hypothetical protein